ncbi:MAG: protein translocase subunit SecD [Solirubrobacterales bacterium]
MALLLIGSLAVINFKQSRLGLDLAGGIELIYQATPNDPTKDPTDRELQNAIKVINDRVNSLGVTEAEVQATGKKLITVSLPDVQDPEQAKSLVGSTAKLLFYKWEDNVVGQPGQTKSVSDAKSASNQGAKTLYEAVKLASNQKPDLKSDGQATFYLFDPKTKKLHAGPAATKADLLDQNDIVTKKALNGQVPEGLAVYEVPKGFTVVTYQATGNNGRPQGKPQYFVLKNNIAMTGNEVKSATPGQDQSGTPAIDLNFTGKGGKIFQQVTKDLWNKGFNEPVLGDRQAASHHFAIVLDGKVISLASIDPTDRSLSQGIAGGRAQITNLSQIEATNVSKKIDLGSLPVSLHLISQTQVSASLGKQALNQAAVAAAIGFALVFLFLLVFYRALGVIAGLALIIYGIFFFAVTKLVGFTFTLPGIAGLVLTLSVAADANIVIFERIKEEIRAGKSMQSAISTGYAKGFSTIIDANVVTLITAFILFVLATAGVRGFAASLGLGTIVSLFTAVVVTSAVLGLLSGWKGLERPSALGVKEEHHKQRWRFDFIGRSKLFFTASGMILVIGALAVAGIGLNLGIDFTGGTKVTVGLDKPLTETQVRAIAAKAGASDAKIQRITGDPALGPYAFQISSDKIEPGDVPILRSSFESGGGIKGTTKADTQFEVNSVGPTFGQVVARSAIIAIIFSLIVIGGYVSLRFSFKFSIPVLIALSHDILITLGVYALLDREVTSATVAALLTILGFSLYDTIIVFDRIRENLPRMPRAAFSQIVNRSMSEVLTRSLATSLVTALPVLALLIFGGSTLQDFAFALLIGTISGTYSSIFIAAPVLTHWKEREPIYKQRATRIAEENGGVVPPFAIETIGGVAVNSATLQPITDEDLAIGDASVDEVAEEIEEAAAEEEEVATSATGAVSRPTTKAERRAARARRKHGR